MFRGGRGGGRAGGAGRIGAKDFEIEADLEDEITAYQNEIGDGDDEWTKTLYPVRTCICSRRTCAQESNNRLTGGRK